MPHADVIGVRQIANPEVYAPRCHFAATWAIVFSDRTERSPGTDPTPLRSHRWAGHCSPLVPTRLHRRREEPQCVRSDPSRASPFTDASVNTLVCSHISDRKVTTVNRFAARIAAITAGTLTIAIATGAGGGVASATDPFAGMRYDKVAASIKSWKGKSEVVSVVGDQLKRDDCIVASSRKDKKGTYLLSLYCDGSYATAGEPGHSAGSPEGRDAAKHEAQVKWLRENPDYCRTLKQSHPEWFKQPVEGCENAPS